MRVYAARRACVCVVFRTLLIQLLKLISDRRIDGKKYRFRYKKAPKNDFECMDNIQVALNYIEAKGIKLVNIGAGDIYHGNMKITLGLIWTLIRVFQIDASEGISENQAGAESQVSEEQISSGAQLLLRWCQGVVAPYSDMGVKVENFAGSFSDGRAFAALIHAHLPDLMDLNALTDDPRANLELVMDVAARNLGIPHMLDPEDVNMLLTKPNSVNKVVQLYVAMLKEQLLAAAAARQAAAAAAEAAADGHGLLQEVRLLICQEFGDRTKSVPI